MSDNLFAAGLAVLVIWGGLILIHTILRHTIARHRNHRFTTDRLTAYVGPPPPAAPDTACFTHGCDRYAGWLWTGADLINRRHVCHDCGNELLNHRGGILTLR